MEKDLKKHGYYVDVANNGNLGEEKAFITHYDAILLDLNLPDADGMEILQKIRSLDNPVPILIVSAKDESKDRIEGLNIGADDYIVKPFLMEELLARIQAVVRRSNQQITNTIQQRMLKVDSNMRKAFYNDVELELANKEFDILEYMVSRHPSLISSEEIAEHVYDDNFNPFSSVLRVHIARLKKKLQLAANREVMVTVRGKGYYLCLD